MATEVDPYECPICLMNMIERNPKLLQCHHSACQPCLIQLIQHNRIVCPTCRAPTDLPPEGIKNLTPNFHLIQMYEREKQFLSKMQQLNSDTCCQMCHRTDAVKKCQECAKRMCSACLEKHSRVTQFASHTLLNLCTKHMEGITHICMHCMQFVCMTCVVMEHEKHESDVKIYQDGINMLRAEMETTKRRAAQTMVKIEVKETKVSDAMQRSQDIMTSVEQKGNYYQSQVDKATSVMKSVSEINKHNRNVLDNLKLAKESGREVLSLVDNILLQSSADLVSNFIPRKQVLQEKSAILEAGLQIQYQVSPFVIAEPGSEEMVRYWKQQSMLNDSWLPNPQCILNVTSSPNTDISFESPQQIIYAGNSVFVANSNPPHVLRLNTNGELLAKYFVPKPQQHYTNIIKGIAVYDDDLYIHTDSQITRYPLGYQSGKQSATFNLGINRICKILVVSRTRIIISDGMNPGKIYDFNPESNILLICKDGLNAPSYLSFAHTEDGPFFVVSLRQQKLQQQSINPPIGGLAPPPLPQPGCMRANGFGLIGNNAAAADVIISDDFIHIYNNKWALVAKINTNTVINHATAITEAGTILVTENSNDRISEYSMDGGFIRYILSKEHGISRPAGVTYNKPHLWIAQNPRSNDSGSHIRGFAIGCGMNNSASIKCFKIAQ